VINPTENLALLISVGLIIAIASATQDITVDALRIEQINENEGKSMAAGAAMAVVGWWTGYKLGGVVALFTAEFFENLGVADYWQATFLILGILIILMNIGLMFVHEPIETNRQAKQRETDKLIEGKLGSSNIITNFIAYITGTIGGPIISFFKKNGFAIAVGILGFVFLFKIGEAFLGRMSIVFYKEIGFTKSDIALYSKGLGWVTTVIFTLLGGLFAIRSGVIKAMFVSGILMASTNLLFSLNDDNYDVFKIDRGGEVTCHMPGQLVTYLVLDLKNFNKDLNWYLRKIEEIIIKILGTFNINCHSREGFTGVWIGIKIIASIGIGCKRWITINGFSINIDCELENFNKIVPCGIENCLMTNMIDYNKNFNIQEVKRIVKKIIQEEFNFDFVSK